MDTENVIPILNIKQEPDYEAASNMETRNLMPSENIQQEPDCEMVKKEAIVEEESDMPTVIKRARTGMPSLSCPEKDSFLYCEKCQLKYEGGCPDHGLNIYVDNAEEGQGEGCSHNSSSQVQATDEHVPESEMILPSVVCETDGDDLQSLDQGTHKRIHIEEKPYKCDVCGAGFTKSGNLKVHKRTHTGEKPYNCDECGACFAQSGSLINHKRKHTGEKPFKCDICGVGFALTWTLKIHMRTHTGEKPYRCDVCGIDFAHNCTLIKHKRTHTGEKPYKCDLCSAGFSQNGHLKEHKRIHQGEILYK